MKRYIITVLMLLAVILTGCASPGTPGANQNPPETPIMQLPASLADSANLRFLISDEKNAIEDFQNFYVSISSIGVHQGDNSTTEQGENSTAEQSDNSSGWIELIPAVKTIDLRLLVGESAQAIWAGNITPGRYNKVFIYVDNVTGILVSTDNNTSDNQTSDNQTASPKAVSVKLPGGKLQISKPFVISENTTSSFVFDITVVAAGNDKGEVKYILKPQIEMSGADQKFKEIKGETRNIPGSDQAKMQIRLDEKAAPNAEVTALVIRGNSPVAGATVSLNGVSVGTTDAKGQVKLTLPGSGEAKILAVSGNITAELDVNLKESKGNGKP